MVITGYDVVDRMVTLYVQDMPKGADDADATVRIGGRPQNEASVFEKDHVITFYAVGGARGDITVEMTLQDGNHFVAQAPGTYPPDDVKPPHEDAPTISYVSPVNRAEYAMPGEGVNLSGSRLGSVKGVYLEPGRVRMQNVVATSSRVKFTVPSAMRPLQETLTVGLTFTDAPSHEDHYLRTNRQLKVRTSD